MIAGLLRQVVGKDHVGSNVISFGEIGKKLGGEWRAMDEVTHHTPHDHSAKPQ